MEFMVNKFLSIDGLSVIEKWIEGCWKTEFREKTGSFILLLICRFI